MVGVVMRTDDSKFKASTQRMPRSLGMGLIGGVLLCGLSSPVLGEEFSRGQALYENHCQTCHETWAHTRNGRRVTSMTELRNRVAAWSNHAGLNWTEEEVGDVTDYLNRTFYRFESTP
jgi:hypothetical protein